MIKIKEDTNNNSKNSSKNINVNSFDSDSGKKINLKDDVIQMGMGGIPSFGMGMGMPSFGMGTGGMLIEDDEWLKGFKMGVEEINNPGDASDQDLNSPGPKINLIFTTTLGTKRNVILNYGKTINDALR